jgi:hypothetical protein
MKEDKPKRLDTGSKNYEVPFKNEGTLHFISQKGDTIDTLDLEIADTEEQRTQGLMYRSTMSDKQSMIFIFEGDRMQSFWMKNTYISLDIIFASSDGTINTIQKNTRPYSEDPVMSNAPSKFVIEVVAGYADLNGLNAGDKFSYSYKP